MQKIIVIGCPGSGKTTFAEKLRGKTVVIFKSREQSDEFIDRLNKG